MRALAVRGGLWLAAGVLAAVALGFLTAALFLALAAGLGAPLAALVMALVYALLALVLALAARGRSSGGAGPDGVSTPALVALLAEAARRHPRETLLLALLAGAVLELTRPRGRN